MVRQFYLTFFCGGPNRRRTDADTLGSGVIMKELGTIIRAARRARGYSQDDLGKLMGKSHTYIASLELGYHSSTGAPPQRPPLPSVLEHLARVLDLDYNHLAALCGYDPTDAHADLKALKDNFLVLSPEGKEIVTTFLDSLVKLEREKKGRG
jgi:transcriptional regulator with XRE-family HTH domain